MAEELGTAVEVHDEHSHAFPVPSRLLELKEFPGLTSVKVERLKSLATAASTGSWTLATCARCPSRGRWRS